MREPLWRGTARSEGDLNTDDVTASGAHHPFSEKGGMDDYAGIIMSCNSMFLAGGPVSGGAWHPGGYGGTNPAHHN